MPQQAEHLAALLAVLVVGLVAARHFPVPPTFGKLGHYRSAAIDSVVAQSIHILRVLVAILSPRPEAEMPAVEAA